MQIARHYRTEEACHGIPLPEALKVSRKPPKEKPESQETKAGQSGKSASQKPIPRKPASGPTGHAAAAGNGPAPANGEDTSMAPSAASKSPEPPQPLTAAEIEAMEAFVEKIGSLSRAEYVFQERAKQLWELKDG